MMDLRNHQTTNEKWTNQNGRPDYSTWFQTATTIVYNKEQLKAHNMADDEILKKLNIFKKVI